MPTGSSMKFMMEAFPERAFDVGIADQSFFSFFLFLTSPPTLYLEFTTPFKIYSNFIKSKQIMGFLSVKKMSLMKTQQGVER